MRKSFTSEFKAKVALQAIKGDKRMAEIASQFDVHPNQVTQWKKAMLAGLPDIFSGKRKRLAQDDEADKSKLYEQIGRLKVELDWLKKKSDEFNF